MSTQEGSSPTSLKALEEELGIVKRDLLTKREACLTSDDDTKRNKRHSVMEEEVKNAGSAFEAVRKEAESLRKLRQRVEQTKLALSKDVEEAHLNLSETLEKVKARKNTFGEHNIFLLRKKVEGAELQLEFAHQKVQKIVFFEAELQEASDELLSVFKLQEKNVIKRIAQSRTAEKHQESTISDLYKSIPPLHSSVNYILSESIVRLGKERDMLRFELETLRANEDVHGDTFQLVYKLENEVRQLKSELTGARANAHEATENEFSIRVKKPENEDIEMDEDEDSYGFEDEGPDLVSEALMASTTKSPPPRAVTYQVDNGGESDSEDDEEMTNTVQSPPNSNALDAMCTSELDDLAFLSPEYEQMAIDQMKHEEELEEYAVKLIALKENISELQKENSQLREKVVAIPEEGELEGQVKKLQEEVKKWQGMYEKSAGEVDSQNESLKQELEQSQAEVVSLKRSERDIATSSMREVERLKAKIQGYKDQVKIIQNDTPTPSRDGDAEETEKLRKEIEELNLAMENESSKVGKEMLQMQRIILALEAEKEEKAEIIENLQLQLHEEKLDRENQLERGRMAIGKRISDIPSIPTIYSYGSYDGGSFAQI